MAIAKLRPIAGEPVSNTPVTPEAPQKSIFTELVPSSKIDSLLKYVEGYPWTVNYRAQILNTNNTVANFDPSAPNLTQPAYLILDLVLQVSSPLSSSYDQQTSVTSLQGTAITPLGLTPNVGDVFLAKVDTAEDAYFVVSSVSRKTHRKQTLYEITYNLYIYTNTDPVVDASFYSTINEKYYFNKDTNYFNRDLLIKPSVKEATDRLKLFLHSTREYYFKTFPQKKTGSILVPGSDKTLYDAFLVDFLYATVSHDYLIDSRLYRHTVPNSNPSSRTILDAIVSRNKILLSMVPKTAGFLPTRELERLTRLNNPYNSGIDYTLQPILEANNIEVPLRAVKDRSLFLDTPLTPQNSTVVADPIVISTTVNDITYQKPVLHEMFKDDYYIVTKTFYDYISDNTEYINLSYLEFVIYRFIYGHAIAREDLVLAIESYNNWSYIHQLYLLPVLWVIIEANIR